jgi:hypothetical protein
MLTNYEHNNPNKAFMVYLPSESQNFFLFGVDETKDSSIYTIVCNNLKFAEYCIYDESSRQNLMNAGLINIMHRDLYGRLHKNHILVSDTIEGMANEIVGNATTVRGFVAVDIKNLDKIANHLNFLGCTVIVANDIEPNPFIEDDEQFYSRVLMVDSNFEYPEVDVPVPAVPVQHTYCYAQRIDDNLMTLPELVESENMAVADAVFAQMSTAQDGDTYLENQRLYVENSRLVLFGAPTASSSSTDDESRLSQNGHP